MTQCPSCGKVVKAPQEYAGRSAKCPGCKSTIQIPADTGPAPPSTHRGSRRLAALICIGLLLASAAFVGGYYVGRESIRTELRKNMESAAKEFRQGIAGAFGGNASRPRDEETVNPSLVDRESASRIQILGATLQTTDSFIGSRQIARVRMRNLSDTPLRSAVFFGKLITPGRTYPWETATFSCEFAGGLEPGEDRIETLVLSDFYVPEQAKLSAGRVFEVSVLSSD